jgi:hypothetical protein
LPLDPSESVVVRENIGAFTADPPEYTPCLRATGTPHPIEGPWRVEFISGGPDLPPTQVTAKLSSWTRLGGETTEAFSGTARYSVRFRAPDGTAKAWQLDLGRVAQSARVCLNGRPLGTAIVAPFRFRIEELLAVDNQLDIEVTSTAANRIRNLDRRKVEWRSFHDINFVNIEYKAFDASGWPVADAGLLGSVTLTALAPYIPSPR